MQRLAARTRPVRHRRHRRPRRRPARRARQPVVPAARRLRRRQPVAVRPLRRLPDVADPHPLHVPRVTTLSSFPTPCPYLHPMRRTARPAARRLGGPMSTPARHGSLPPHRRGSRSGPIGRLGRWAATNTPHRLHRLGGRRGRPRVPRPARRDRALGRRLAGQRLGVGRRSAISSSASSAASTAPA